MAKKTTKKKSQKSSGWHRIFDHFSRSFHAVQAKQRAYVKRRVHRSFKKTDKHDMPVRPRLPGFWGLTIEVLGLAGRFKLASLFFVLFYAGSSSVIVGFIQQDNYQKIVDVLNQVGAQVLHGQYDRSVELVSAAGVIMTGGLNGPLTEAQQLAMLLLGLIVWLCVVWYLRHRLAGKAVRIRDALYNGCAPLVSSVMVGLVMLLQLLPVLIGGFLYVTAALGGALDTGVVSMTFGLAVALLGVLSLYWVSASQFALVIVTLPGMYPAAAFRQAGDIAAGKRLALVVRLLWLFGVVVVGWLMILVPVIWLMSQSWMPNIPLVPVVAQLLSGATAVFVAAYIYVLYRKLIDV